MNEVTILIARSGRQAKRVSRTESGYRIDPAEHAFLYRFITRPVEGLHDFHALLRELECQSDRFIIYGAPAVVPGEWRPRRLYPRDGEPATVLPMPRPYLILDIDDVCVPESVRSLTVEDAHRILLDRLPPDLKEVDCLLQFTGSHAYRGDRSLRARLVFWVSRACWPEQFKHWLAEYPVDPVIFTPSQPIYTSRPVLADGVASLVPLRTFFIAGEERVLDASVLPEVEEVRESVRAPTGVPGKGYAHYRALIGLDGHFNVPLRSAVGAYLAGTESPDLDWLEQDLAAAIRASEGTRDRCYIAMRLRDLKGLIRNMARVDAIQRRERNAEIARLTAAIGLQGGVA